MDGDPWSDAGHPEAMYNIGLPNMKRGDVRAALNWWRRSADAGFTTAMFRLGTWHADQGDLDQTFTWLQSLDEADGVGVPESVLTLGHLAEGSGDLGLAIRCHTKASNAGIVDAMFRLGMVYEKHGEVDDAMYWLGAWYAARDDKEQAFVGFTRASDAGNAQAMI